jgi:Zn-finger protein
MKVIILDQNGRKAVDLNRRKAIRQRCLNCAGWSHKELTNCIFSDCPLYPFRSGQGKQNAKARLKAIRKYCLWCMNGQHGEVSRCPSTDCSLFPYRKTRTDSSTEIKSLPKKGHIRSSFGDKIKSEYPKLHLHKNNKIMVGAFVVKRCNSPRCCTDH